MGIFFVLQMYERVWFSHSNGTTCTISTLTLYLKYTNQEWIVNDHVVVLFKVTSFVPMKNQRRLKSYSIGKYF